MAIHNGLICETWQAHVAVSLDAGEADRPAEFLDRFEHEREEEERLRLLASDMRCYGPDCTYEWSGWDTPADRAHYGVHPNGGGYRDDPDAAE